MEDQKEGEEPIQKPLKRKVTEIPPKRDEESNLRAESKESNRKTIQPKDEDPLEVRRSVF